MVFNWKWLIIAIIIFAAITTSDKSYGKWTFALVMIGIVLNFGDKILPKTGV
jgi:hypothetical protein